MSATATDTEEPPISFVRQRPADAWTHITLCVKTPKGIKYVTGIVHRTDSPETRLLGAGFYEEFCVDTPIPQGIHHEIQVFPCLWAKHPGIKIHTHESPKGGSYYMCWTNSIPDTETAQSVFKVWAVGTLHTLLGGEDLNITFDRAGNDVEKFLTLMQTNHGIMLIDSPPEEGGGSLD